MKKSFFYVFIFMSTMAFAQQKPLVKAVIDTAQIRIGEQIEYTLSVDVIDDVIIPKLENLKGLEIVEERKIDTLKNQLVKRYLLTGFDSGAFYIPQQQIFIRQRLHLTDSLLVKVATVAIDTIKQPMFPIKSIKQEPYQFDDFIPYLWYVILGLLLLGGILYFIFRKKKTPEEKIAEALLPPYEEAIQRLQQLDKKLLWQNNKIKEYYSELTAIVRGYIERELNVPALESTTDELVETLADFNKTGGITTSEETIKKLRDLLREADLVKFAKSTPMAIEIEENRKDAEEVVSNLKPTIVKEEEDGLE